MELNYDILINSQEMSDASPPNQVAAEDIAQRAGNIWYCFGKSIRGATHVLQNITNQDAIDWYPRSGSGTPMILAVADGHGGPRHFRSKEGARFAVTAAIKSGLSLSEILKDTKTVEEACDKTTEFFPNRLVETWKDRVAYHLMYRPFTPQEWNQLKHNEMKSRLKEVALKPILAFGSTIICVIITNKFLIYVQLGDGDILSVTDIEEVKRPLKSDDRLVANHTTSLCLDQATLDFRIRVQKIDEEPPALILISTDGYSNSFAREDGFIKAGSDILQSIRTHGWPKVTESLAQWLNAATEQGSGDDISVGLIVRQSAIEKTDTIEKIKP